MIRNSALVATVAVAVSLLAHLFGVNVLVRVQPERPPEDSATGDVSLGNAFEDIAEPASQPAEPEPAAAPEPPIEAVTEAPPVERETSLALVESANPQPSTSPGLGHAPAALADTISPAEPTPSSAPEPESADQPVAAEAEAQPTEVPPISDALVGSEALRPEPSAMASIEPAPAAPTEPSPSEAVAALPLEVAPVLPVPPSTDPDALPVILEQVESVDTPFSAVIAAPVPEPDVVDEAGDLLGGTQLAVLASPRPPARPSRPSARAAAAFGDEPPPILFPESPLAAYARDRNLDGWGNTLGTGVSGNATVTNYAGQVLVRLNRAPGKRVISGATARVLFKINRDGTLAWVEVVDSTGTFEFDSAAKEQVRNAAPFPPPPEGAQREFSFTFRSAR